MTPKEKAIELWEKYFQLNYDWDGATKDQWAKEGALIALDEILSSCGTADIRYWQEVKKELESL